MDVLISLVVWCLYEIVVWCLCGWGCYKIAENNGRDKTLAAVLGVLFGLFAVLGYVIAGKKTVA